MAEKLRVGRYTDEPEPFMGPVISPTAAERLLAPRPRSRRRAGMFCWKCDLSHRPVPSCRRA